MARPKADGDWHIQIGKNKSAYKDKHIFPADKASMAMLYYRGLNVHSGYKKRLVTPHGDVIGRVLT